MKLCRKCQQTKPLEEFFKARSTKDGYRSICKECDTAQHQRYVERSRPAVREWRRGWYRENAEKIARQNRSYFDKYRAKFLVRSAASRARKYSLPFDLDAHTEELQARIDAGRCELTNIPFVLDGARDWAGPSLDRIIPANGYVYSNIRVICRAMNCALGEWGGDVLNYVIDEWRRNSGG